MSSDSILNSLQFSFYSPDQIRQLSVKEITSLISFEPTLGKGAVGGVYDSILGSLSDRESCRNCNLSYYECNGHFGHIEFPKPVYNPMLFDYLVKLIKATCFYCHKLNLSQGLGESIVSLGSNDSCLSIQRYHQLDELRSLTVTDKEKQAIKIMSSQLRRKCVNCGKSPLVFSKSRKCEILVHVGKKMRKSGDEPDEKKRKMDDSLAAYDSAYSEDVLYGSFVESDAPISPDVIREHLRILWSKDHENLKLIFPILKMGNFEYPTDVFFMDNMLINPPMNRLPAHLHDGQMTESPETANMVNVVRASFALREVLKKTESVNEKQRYQNIREGILELQKRVNISYDSNMHREIRDAQPGLRQRIDKKTGLFRENIMGKRVNFSCRSVISPDPNVGLNEIGVPTIFLSKLTFPEHMNNLNKEFLKQCVLNGPNVYPGAVSYQIDGAAPVAIFSDCESIVEYIDLKFQEKRKVVVNRHAISGDVLIMNRQPTLHKPSMQAHNIKAILDPKAKTLRMHYSNCKAYNADFDGDEMNGHFLQSLHAKSEAKHIVNACYQHSTPKDGSPLSGLIQDHIIAGTRMCMRDCFLERHEYIDLVFNGIGITGVKVKLMKPAIMKPKQLWTGKQVLSTILINSINSGVELPNIVCYEPKKKALWKTSKLEDKDKLSDIDLIIVDGYVCTGIFDKVHLGPAQKGLRSDLRELYGSFVEMQILTNLSRLLNRYLIYTGFSTSFKDGLVDKRGNTIRETAKNEMKLFGVMAIANAFKINCKELTQEKIAALMEKAQFDKSDEYRNKMKDVDIQFKLLSGQLVNKLGIQKKHLKVQFPENNLSFMSNTGAKGNDSNLTKIACALGAIEIEGKRCPLTIAGRTLPSFKRYDSNPAARGFCINRFSTGLTPQEIFFESMAGRDGLVDTAVKTSSSGYLQRCVIKQLEDIVVAHDYTVRDNMDNIIQFKYGYDGLDVVNSVFLSKPDLMEVFGRNLVLMKKKYLTRELSNDSSNSDLPITIQQRIDTMVSKLKEDNINLTCVEISDLKEIIKRRCQIALCSPGEAVGLLAAQSIGEPSTQMTLNTFHNAGQSDMNVTLGIPRLREILMTSSENIKTPSMTVPILGTPFAKNNVPVVLKKFNKLLLKDVIELPFPLTVNRYMEITFNFKRESSYRDLTNLSRRELITIIERTFMKSLAKTLKKYSGSSSAEIKQEKDNDDRVEVNEMEVDNDREPDEKEKDDDTDDDLSDLSDAKSNHDAEEEGEEDEEESDEDDIENDNDDNQSTKEATTESGITNKNLVGMCLAFKDYQIHKSKKPKWIKLILNIYNCNIDLKSLILQLLETTVLSSIDGIEKALIIAKDNCFATEGYNISELFKYDQVFDLNQFYSNNIQKMAKLYGVEVAVKCLEIEIAKVFGAYGIDVNSRHLRLIADYLTTSGRVGGFNRNSMKNHPSQIQRASFETALKVLNEMMVHGNKDFIKSPSANIMLGQPVSNIGTNSVHLLYDMSA